MRAKLAFLQSASICLPLRLLYCCRLFHLGVKIARPSRASSVHTRSHRRPTLHTSRQTSHFPLHRQVIPRREYSPSSRHERTHDRMFDRRTEFRSEYCAGGLHPIDLGDCFCEGRYEVIRKLGYGSFSTVWLAMDLKWVKVPVVRFR